MDAIKFRTCNIIMPFKQSASIYVPKRYIDEFLKQTDYNLNNEKKQSRLRALHYASINLTCEDVNNIEQMSNEDAAKYCFKLICNSLEIPDEIAPEFSLETTNKDEPRLCGQYNYMTNELTYYTNSNRNTKNGKWWTFGLIRHEVEHFRQNIDMLRNEEIAQKLLDHYLEDIDSLKTLEEFKGKEDEIEAEKELYKKEFKAFRAKILSYYPPIQNTDEEYKRAKKYFDSYTNYTLGTKGILDRIKYFTQPIEFEACKTQGFNWINYFSKKLCA